MNGNTEPGPPPWVPPSEGGSHYDPTRPGPWARGGARAGEDPQEMDTWRWAVDLPRITAFNWGEFGSLISARNEKLGERPEKPRARWLFKWLVRRPVGIEDDPAGRLRDAWLSVLRESPEQCPTDPDRFLMRPVDGSGDATARFLLIGDPGEGDLSQWAVRRPLVARAGQEGVDFAVILSDVIYPAGEALHYRDRFHGPLRELEAPVYAIPGNHDWNDGSLASFMAQFTKWTPPDVDDLLPQAVRARIPGRSRIWRDASRGEQDAFGRLVGLRDERDERLLASPRTRYPVAQPAPYFAIEAGGVLVIGVDNGFGAGWEIDANQSDWLRGIVDKHPDMPKVLLLGKPLATGGVRKRIPLTPPQGGSPDDHTLDRLATPDNGFVAVIGGDVHNYQRYSPPAEPHLIVAGGSGAYMGGTIGNAERARRQSPPLVGPEPVLYPTEAQSRWYLGTQFAERIRLAPMGVAISALLTLLVLALLSGLAASVWRNLAVLGLVPLVALAGISFLLAAAGPHDPPGQRPARGIGVALIALAVAGAIAAPLGLLLEAAIDEPGLARLAAIIAFPAVASLVAAAFLPYGVLAQAFPVPSGGHATALVGGLGLTYLLVLAYPAIAGDILEQHDSIRLLVLLLPTALIAIGYGTQIWRAAKDGGRGTVVLASLPLTFGLASLAAHLWWERGHELTLALAAASALSVVAVLVLAALLKAAAVPLALIAFPALAIVFLGVQVGPASAPALGRALVPALLLALALGAAIFALLRLFAGSFGAQAPLVEWLSRKGLDLWSVLERSEPPFFKSFVEVRVTREEEIVILAWGVSGLEADAERPVLIDRIAIPWPSP